METFRHGDHVLRERLPLKPSLEGWKLDIDAYFESLQQPLETFLRGMETYRRAAGGCRGGFLETFLRGMETDGRCHCPKPVGRLETFLRGMETLERQCGLEGVKSPLKPSLEGWKPSSSKRGSCLPHSLKPSLEGWKLGQVFRFAIASDLLETFLRGMETPYSCTAVGALGALETFLRGMETHSASRTGSRS